MYTKPLLNYIWVSKKGPKGDYFFGLLRLYLLARVRVGPRKGAMTLSIATLSITTLSKMTLSIKIKKMLHLCLC